MSAVCLAHRHPPAAASAGPPHCPAQRSAILASAVLVLGRDRVARMPGSQWSQWEAEQHLILPGINMYVALVRCPKKRWVPTFRCRTGWQSWDPAGMACVPRWDSMPASSGSTMVS